MQRFDLSTLVPGAEVRGTVCVRSREAKQTREGKPYLVIELGNATGRSTARIWSERLPDWEEVRAGDAVELHARVQAGWRGGAPELDILSVARLPENHPIRLELNPHSPISREVLEERFDGLVRSIRRPDARHLLEVVLDRVGRERFMTAPAAVMNHHAYLGGLAEHSIEVAEMALSLGASDRYAGLLDRDAIVIGALLHDIGKTEEYEWEGVPIRISRAGRLRSHTSRGAEIVALAVSNAWSLEAGTVSELDVRHVQHVIESHHGQADWGSPTPPRTLEATLIHHADLVSARLRALADDLETGSPDEERWIDPTTWKRAPVWAFSEAVAAEEERRAAEPSAWRTRWRPLPWEMGESEDGETAAYVLPLRGGDDA